MQELSLKTGFPESLILDQIPCWTCKVAAALLGHVPFKSSKTGSSQLEVIRSHREHLATPRDIPECHSYWTGGATGISEEARDAAKHPTMHRTAPKQRIIWPKMLTV